MTLCMGHSSAMLLCWLCAQLFRHPRCAAQPIHSSTVVQACCRAGRQRCASRPRAFVLARARRAAGQRLRPSHVHSRFESRCGVCNKRARLHVRAGPRELVRPLSAGPNRGVGACGRHLHGIGMPQSASQARKYFSKAAEAVSHTAMLCVLYVCVCVCVCVGGRA